jgi:hypothetical protein
MAFAVSIHAIAFLRNAVLDAIEGEAITRLLINNRVSAQQKSPDQPGFSR